MLHDITLHVYQTCHKINYVTLDFVVSCWHCCLRLYCPSFLSIQRETYESLCQSIYLVYCLSCWVSVSHVRALAVKTSVDEVSADTAPLLNQWPLKVWEQALLSHWVEAEGDGRFILGGEDAVTMGVAAKLCWGSPPHLAPLQSRQQPYAALLSSRKWK